MSVSDPLIKDTKACTLKLINNLTDTEYISDTNPNLIHFCENVEKIFTVGLNSVHTAFGFLKLNEAWYWLEKAAVMQDNAITFGYINSVEEVKRYQHILTNVGKLRLLIRNLLSRKSMYVPVKYLLNNKRNGIYKETSILGDEILSEILLSVFLQCSRIHFKLDLSNASFLDTSWELPELLKLELVPCKNLGMSISFANNKAVIIDIKSNSVIAENSKVEVGDVLDNLNGVHICLATKGKLNTILKSSKGLPVTLTIIKTRSSSTNELYKPIVQLLHQVHIDPSSLINDSSVQLDKNSDLKKQSAGFKATYYGFVNTGRTGDVKQIDKSVRLLLCPYKGCVEGSDFNYKIIKKNVFFEVGEIGVKVVDCLSSNIILKHSYMEISSCGSVSHLPYYFAYIAGNENCNQATEFTCYVFHIKKCEMAYTILQSIGQGFHRTHFAV
ncbi:hypothetical protein RN001_014066 [Aquatica leii]|uniref:RUN domain-containing protein n=1 Tax=Aquatica leii TaxID=1421715 RepID=A0AAN7P3P6_9COLE|nr:hypothetical protein RN001_014066 [Aquatica leii]